MPATPSSVLVALIAVQLLFALHYVATKVVLAHIPPSAWAALRVTAAAVLYLLLAAARRRRLPLVRGVLLRLAGLSLLGVVLNQVLFVEGLSRTLPSHSALINTTIPVFTLAVAVVLGHESLSRRKTLALTLSLAGVLVLLLPQRPLLDGATLEGDLLTLGNALSFSVFLVLSRPLLRSVAPLAAAPLLFAFGALPILAYGAPSLMALRVDSLPAAVVLLGLGIVIGPTVGAYLLNYWALARVESSHVALFIYLQFLLAAPLSWWLLHEPPSWRLAPAALLVFGGVGLAASGPPARAVTEGP